MAWSSIKGPDHDFRDHPVTGCQYRAFFEPKSELIGRQLADFLERALREFGPAWLPLALAVAAAGLSYLFRHGRPVFWRLVTAAAVNLAYNVNYEIAEDKDAYYLPVFLVIAVAAASRLKPGITIAQARSS
jgi:hypothetical protein